LQSFCSGIAEGDYLSRGFCSGISEGDNLLHSFCCGIAEDDNLLQRFCSVLLKAKNYSRASVLVDCLELPRASPSTAEGGVLVWLQKCLFWMPKVEYDPRAFALVAKGRVLFQNFCSGN
jgi:hypothetical protein